MAFGRSSSGPGGLSINTGSANSLFSTSQAQSSGGIFGSSAASSQPQQGGVLSDGAKPQGGGLFGSPAATSGGMFGSTNQQSQPQQAAGLFGAATSQPQNQSSGGLFGSSTQQSQPQQSGGLFGATLQPPQSQAPPSAGLFGSLSQQSQSQSQSQPQQGGGLFGSSVQQSQPQPQQSGGLFGSALQQSQPQQGSSLFGASIGQNQNQNQQQQQQGGLFGSLLGQNQNQVPNQTQPQSQQGGSIFGSLNQPASNTLGSQTNPQQQGSSFPSLGSTSQNNPIGGLLFGQSTQLQQTVPGVKIDLSNLRTTTRFTDLHEDVQAEIEKIDKMILEQIGYAEQVASFTGAHSEKLAYLPNDVNYLTHRLATLSSALENDAQAIAHVRDLTSSDGGDAKLSFRAVDNLRLPPQYHVAGALPWNAPPQPASRPSRSALDDTAALSTDDEASNAPKDLVAFFGQRADGMASALQSYEQNVAAIETHLRGVEARTAQQLQSVLFARGRDGAERSADEQVRELAGVLRDFENGILTVASSVGGAREGVQELLLGRQSGEPAGGKFGRR